MCFFENEEFDVILLAGQSNAEGSGVGEVESEYQEDERILMMMDTYPVGNKPDKEGNIYLDAKLPTEYRIEIAREEVNAKKAKIGNFALQFAENYVRNCLKINRKVLIIKAAVGGTGFCKKQWTVDGILYKRAVDMMDKALRLNKGNKLVAVLWHQGECDAFEGNTPDNYRKQLTSMIENLRSRYGNMPFIAGDFANEWKSKNIETCEPIIDTIQKVLQNCGNAGFVETSDLLSNNQKTGNGDDIHFCRESLYELGKRYFNEFNKLYEIF